MYLSIQVDANMIKTSHILTGCLDTQSIIEFQQSFNVNFERIEFTQSLETHYFSMNLGYG